MVKLVTPAVGAQLAQQHRRGNLAGLDRQRHLHQILPMGFDQLPVGGVGEQAIDVLIGHAAIRSAHDQVAPIADAWHEVDTQQVGKGEHRGRLSLGVGIHRIRFHAEVGLEQTLNYVDRLPDARRDEVLKHGDVVVGHVPISHRAHLAVAEVVAGQQVVVVEVELGAVGRHRLAVAPQLGQIKLQVELHQLPVGLVQFLQREMAPVGVRKHMRRDIPGQMSCRLVGPQVAAHGEDGHQVAFGWVFELRLVAGYWPEMPGELNPVLDVGHDVEHVSGGHTLDNGRLQ
ncbi:hypothetical protein D9M72_404510 [compost metagenome]